MKEPIRVGGVWLRSLRGRLEVLVETADGWRIAISEAGAFCADGTPYTVSHIANSSGHKYWPADPITKGAE